MGRGFGSGVLDAGAEQRYPVIPSMIKIWNTVMVHVGHAIHKSQLLIVQHFYPSRAVALHIQYGIFLLAHVLFVEIIVHQDIRAAVVVEIGYFDHFYCITATVSIFKYKFDQGAERVILIAEANAYHILVYSVITVSHYLVRHAVAVHVFESNHCTFTFRGITHVEFQTAVVQGKGIFPFPIYPATCGEDVEQAVTIDIV